jgi:DNA polymerase-3 subunit epsilon
VFDVETTGLSAVQHRITEIGMVKINKGKIVSEFSALVNPEQYIPSYITELTGISNEMVYDKPVFSEVLPYIKEFAFDTPDVILGGHNVSFDYKFLNESLQRCGEIPVDSPTLCTARLARRLNRNLRSKSLYSLSQHYGINVKRRHRALDDALATAKILLKFINTLVTEYEFESIDEVLSYQYKKIYETGKIPPHLKKIKQQIKHFPNKPGVYFMKDKQNEIIYVGKAKNLNSRVRSYFYHNVSHTPKIKKMLRYVQHVEFTPTGSELSALILESRLIKQFKPRFNTATKRYSMFPFIKIDVQNDYPTADKTYEVKLDGARYYGPFRSSYTVNSLLDRIYKSHSLRKCDYKKLKPDEHFSPCMYFEFKQCNAPCNYTQSLTSYRSEVKEVITFLESEASPGALQMLEKKMFEHAEELNFEEASRIRDKISDLKKVMTNMVLTSAEINLKNYIVKCHETNEDQCTEVFFVSGGKLQANVFIPPALKESGSANEKFKELIKNIYFRGNLFGSVLYNNYGKYNKEELDSMKIISNWIYQNNSQATFLKVTAKTSVDDILQFIFTGDSLYTVSVTPAIQD